MNNNININALASALAHASKHASAARTAYDAALALSKRSKSRAILLDATTPLYTSAVAEREAAQRAFDLARNAEVLAADLLSLEQGIQQCLQGATVQLNVDFHQVASLVQVGAAYRKVLESPEGNREWKCLRDIRLGGIWDSVSVEVSLGHNDQICRFDVGFGACYEDREGKKVIRRFSVARVDGSGYNLTSTNFDFGQVPVRAFSQCWQVIEVLGQVSQYLDASEAKDAREAIYARYNEALTNAVNVG